MTTYNFCFYLQNRLIQTSQTGGKGTVILPHLEFPGPTYKYNLCGHCSSARNPRWRGRLSTVDLLVLTSLDQLLLMMQTLFTFFTKQATLMRNLTMLSLPLQWVFLVLSLPPSGFRGLIELKVSDLAKQVFKAFRAERVVQKHFCKQNNLAYSQFNLLVKSIIRLVKYLPLAELLMRF